MAQNARSENELGTASDKCHTTICDEAVASGSTNNKNAENLLCVQGSGAAATSFEGCMQKLKLERVSWKTMYEERKKTYKLMKEHLNSEPLKLAWDNCADALLDEDKQFLNDIPHYENTLAKMDQVVEVASICMYMKHKSAHITAKITAIAEQQAMAVKKEIIKHAESYYV